jgi:hypothetical protein
MQYQWPCQCDGAPPEVPLPTSLNAEVQVSPFTLQMKLYDATLCGFCTEFLNECTMGKQCYILYLLKLLNESEQNVY